MVLKVTTAKDGRCVIVEQGSCNVELDRLEGDRAVVIRSAEMLWNVEIKEDGYYPLF